MKLSEMIETKLKLEEFLKDCFKLIIIGIGNDIRGDDGLGPYIINQLSNEYVSNNNTLDADIIHFSENILLINGGNVPENFTEPIKKFNPSHIIFIDACLMNMNPGDINTLSKKNIVNISVSTHSMSLAYLVKYLESSDEDKNNSLSDNSINNFRILFIGIEPEIMDLSFDLTGSVKETCDNLIKILTKLINQHNSYASFKYSKF